MSDELWKFSSTLQMTLQPKSYRGTSLTPCLMPFWANTISHCAGLLVLAHSTMWPNYTWGMFSWGLRAGGSVLEHSTGFPGSCDLTASFHASAGLASEVTQARRWLHPQPWFIGGTDWCHTLHLHAVKCNIILHGIIILHQSTQTSVGN